MADSAHGHGHGHGHGGGGVEPDVRRVGAVVGWGIGLFLFVLASIGVLTGYFWWEHRREDAPKIHQVSLVGDQMREIHAREDAKLTQTQKLETGGYRIPIDRAMELVVRDGLR